MSNNWWDRSKKRLATKSDIDRTGIPEGVRDWEVNKGGWRYNEKGDDFYLTWKQLLEFENKNVTVTDDDAFYEWFEQYRADEKIWDRTAKSRSYSSGGYGGGYSDWEDDDEPKKKGKWLSSWWAKDVYKGFSTSSSTDNKLALVLQAVRTTIRVVDDTVPPLSVSWATNEMSYTDFKSHKIVINPAPVQDPKIEDGQAVDITTGFALHEASHSQYSREPYQALLEPEPLRPMQVAGMLLNFIEDIRIEAASTEQFPGFAGYFEKSLGWAWDKSKPNIPSVWGPKLHDKLNAVFCIMRFAEGPAHLKDESFKDEIPWWLNWRDEYMAAKVNARTTIQRGIDRLAEDPDTKAEMEAMAEEEKAREKMFRDLKEMLDKLTEEGLAKMDIEGVDGPTEPGETLDDETGKRIETLIGEELRKEKIFIETPDGRGNAPLYVRHPQETQASRRMYIGKPNPVLARLRAALMFRQELPRFTTRLLKSGNLDEEELWRWKDNDFRVFNEEVIATRPQTQLSFLVDMSGSMYGQKLRSAQELAQLFIWALKDMEGVDTKVFGHTGDVESISIELYRLWEPGESMTRLGLINSMPHSQNYDGHAIAWCAKELLTRGQPDEQRILFVLSDGYPAASGYGGPQGEQHVKMVTTWAEAQGVQVIQIAIDPSLDPARQARMFKTFMQFTNLADVPKQLTRLLAKLI